MKQYIEKLTYITFVIFCFGYIFVQGDSFGLQNISETLFLPGMKQVLSGQEEKVWTEIGIERLYPLYGYVNKNAPIVAQVEDELTYEMLLSQQANDESSLPEDIVTPSQNTTPSQTTAALDMSIEKLRDFDYLIRNFYTVDSTTSIGPEQLKVDDLLSRNMKINTQTKGPKILIFHTHSQEAFADSTPGDANTSIVGMGQYLAELLNLKGVPTMHHNGVYDLINGKLDRSKAYEMSEAGVRKILKENPSIEVVIDMHRDGVPDTTHLVTNVNGKQTAKIMFFNGLSRTKTNGDIAYLKNPYIQDNLSFSLQMQLQTESMYPGFARRIYLKGYRYSLHMMPKSLLIEAGAQTNTVEEMKNAMELLANVLAEVLL